MVKMFRWHRKRGATPVPSAEPSTPHSAAAPMHVAERIAELVGNLGPTLVAVIAGTRNRDDVPDWELDVSSPDDDQLDRIGAAWDVWNLVSADAGDDIARAWFIGANPRLGESPAVALGKGRLDEVRSAAGAFLENDGGGF